MEVMIKGNLVHEPKSKSTQTGMDVCEIRVAENYTVKGEQKTQYMDCVGYGDKAVQLNKLVKGQFVQIYGDLRDASYTGRDGTLKVKWNIIVKMMDAPYPKDRQTPRQTASSTSPYGMNYKPQEDIFSSLPEIKEDELPF